MLHICYNKIKKGILKMKYDVVVRETWKKTGKYVFVVKELNKEEIIEFMNGFEKTNINKKNFMVIEHR